MDCKVCQELIGSFIDNDLAAEQAVEVRDHLGFCHACAKVCEEVTSLIDACQAAEPSELLPPTSKAIWCRINNIIESDLNKPVPVEEPRPRWRFSFLQVASAVLIIAVVSSVATLLVLRSYTARQDDLGAQNATPTTLEKLMGRVGLIETPQQIRDRRLKERESAIEYWNARVQQRRLQWDRPTREAFDRNLQVIEESVNDYTQQLQQNPDDELSGEMLDAVMNDKMNLLRDFSDL